MDPKLQALMARRARLMDDIDEDACYREDDFDKKPVAQTPVKPVKRGGKVVSGGTAEAEPTPSNASVKASGPPKVQTGRSDDGSANARLKAPVNN